MQTGYADEKKPDHFRDSTKMIHHIVDPNKKEAPHMPNINIKYRMEHPNDAEYTHEDGQTIKGVRHCLIKMQPGQSAVAILDIYLDGLDIEAEPLLSLEAVWQSAHFYGYKLVPLKKKKDPPPPGTRIIKKEPP